MTMRDRKDIKRLYFFSNYTKASIGRLYGLSRTRIGVIINEELTAFNTGYECVLCSNEDEVQSFSIDSNSDNNRPQNIIMLCEPDKRRIIHLQLRRRKGIIQS